MPRWIALAAALLVALLLFPQSASAQPAICGFQGTVTAGGEGLPDGTQVTAWIDGTQVAQAKTSNSTYSLFITGSYSGKTVTFKVGKYTADQTGTWTAGATQTVNLSIESWPYQCEFYGEVTVDGQPVPDGTEVSAWVDEAKVQATTTVDSMYTLTVPGNYTGKAVTFKVGSYYADQIVLWQRGEAVKTNLRVSLGPLVCGFYGPVTLDGQTPEDDTVVTAWVGSKRVGQCTVTDGKFGLNIPGDYTGKIVTFKVDGRDAKEKVMWVRGGNVQTTLTARTVGPVGVTVQLSASELKPGDSFTLSVIVDPNGHGISGGEVNLLMLDASVMEILEDEASAGGLLGTEPAEGIKEKTSGDGYQSLTFALGRKGETPLPTASGTLASIGLRIVGGAKPGKYAIPNAITLTDENFEKLEFDPPIVSVTVVPVLPGDLNGDDTVGLADLAILASAYGLTSEETGYLAEADLNSNGEIDIGDLAILGSNWGKRRY